MISRVWPASTMQYIRKQFKDAGAPLTRTQEGNGYVKTINGVEVLRALRGSNGRYLVRYQPDLFKFETFPSAELKINMTGNKEPKKAAGPVNWIGF